MKYCDTHTHLFLPEFDADRDATVERAIQAGVDKMILPNVDSTTYDAMLALCDSYPANCFPAVGVHPTSIKENYREELKLVENQLKQRSFVAIGEIGLDLYWDKTFLEEQKQALITQISWAKDLNIPVLLHVRDAFEEIAHLLKPLQDGSLRGVFHCFSGSYEQAQRIIDLGFYMGIGGVLTFKNSKLHQVIEKLDLKHFITETDAPYITPHPHRGKRNESSYIPLIAAKIAEVKQQPLEIVADQLYQQALSLFALSE